MSKIVGWCDVANLAEDLSGGEADYVVPADDASDEEMQSGPMSVQVQIVELADDPDEDVIEAIDGVVEASVVDDDARGAIATVCPQRIYSHTETICQHVSNLKLISYGRNCDITYAATIHLQKLIDAGEQTESLDYFRILEEAQKVISRQAARCEINGAELSSPNLCSLIEFIGDKMSAQ